MRILLLTLLTLVSLNKLTAQTFTADAGSDTVLCSFTAGQFALGGLTVANGGIPPYTYRWTSGFPNKAHLYLDDTTSQRPRLMKDSGSDVMSFSLIATDATNKVATSSIQITFSRMLVTSGKCDTFKNENDTVRLYATATSNFLPVTLKWTTPDYLSDANFFAPYTWTPVTKTYVAEMKNAKGCIITKECKIDVFPTSVNDMEKSNEVAIYPNPVNAQSIVEVPASMIGGTLKVYTADGREVHRDILKSNKTEIGHIFYGSISAYYYSIQVDSRTVAIGRLIAE